MIKEEDNEYIMFKLVNNNNNGDKEYTTKAINKNHVDYKKYEEFSQRRFGLAVDDMEHQICKTINENKIELLIVIYKSQFVKENMSLIFNDMLDTLNSEMENMKK